MRQGMLPKQDHSLIIKNWEYWEYKLEKQIIKRDPSGKGEQRMV